MELLIAIGKQRLSDLQDELQGLEDKYGHTSALGEMDRYKELNEEIDNLSNELEWVESIDTKISEISKSNTNTGEYGDGFEKAIKLVREVLTNPNELNISDDKSFDLKSIKAGNHIQWVDTDGETNGDGDPWVHTAEVKAINPQNVVIYEYYMMGQKCVNTFTLGDDFHKAIIHVEKS